MAKFKPSRLMVLLSVFITIIIIVLFATAYFVFIYERVPVDSIAEEFCACAENQEVLASEQRTSREGFLYKVKVNDCFGKIFADYDDGLTYEEELEYVIIIRDRIFQKCPNSLANIYATN
jgi:hypothetical protein